MSLTYYYQPVNNSHQRSSPNTWNRLLAPLSGAIAAYKRPYPQGCMVALPASEVARSRKSQAKNSHPHHQSSVHTSIGSKGPITEQTPKLT